MESFQSEKTASKGEKFTMKAEKNIATMVVRVYAEKKFL